MYKDSTIALWMQGAKKVIFTACHLGKLRLAFTSPNIISTSPKNVLMSRLISQFFCNLNSSKKFTCPFSKLRTEFTSPIAKSTSPRQLDTTFFARWDEKGSGSEEVILLTWQWKMYSGDSFWYFMFHISATPSGSWGASSLLLYEATSNSGYWKNRREQKRT